MGKLETVCLALVVLVAVVLIYASFQPGVRFADPAAMLRTDQFTGTNRLYNCYYDKIYLGQSNSDVLILGSSRTNNAFRAEEVSAAYKDVRNGQLDVFVFHLPWSNPEILYFIFRDYLQKNPAPEAAFFELTAVNELPAPVRYVHPGFADLAPPYLYLDVLTSQDMVRHPLFAISDFLRLLIRHIDINLTKLLASRYLYTVPEGENCAAENGMTGQGITAAPTYSTFASKLANEVSTSVPDIPGKQVGSPDSLLETYEGNPRMTRYVEVAIATYGNPQAWRDESHFWRLGAQAERSLDYYRRIVELANQYDVKLGFYFLPELMMPEPPQSQIDELSNALGVPLFTLPYDITRVSYHHYKDGVHSTPRFRPVYASWLAGLIDRNRAD